MRKLCMCFSGGSFCFALLFVYTHMHTFLGTLIYTHTQSWFDWYRKNLVRSHDYEMEFSWLFFHCFFLCFVFLCSLFFLALLNAVRCCYLLVILVLLLLFRLLHTFTSSSVYRTKVALSGLFYCGLPWSLSLSFFIEIWLIWQALVVNVDLALCARCTFIDFLFILGIFFYQFFCRAMCKMINERRARKEVLQSSQQFLLSLDFLLFLFLFLLLVSVAFVQFRRLSQKNADKLTNICTFFFRIGIIFLLLCVFFSSMALNTVCRFLHPSFIKSIQYIINGVYVCFLRFDNFTHKYHVAGGE